MNTHVKSSENPESTGFPAWWRFCVAPMMEATDRHCRYFHRLLSRRARLYTEMLHAQAVVRGNRARLLDFHPAEHPVVLQLGGSEPALLAQAAHIGEDCGYDEINLNCGCPSDRVQRGRFGACLMLEPARVADCVAAMRAAVRVPVTIKCRIGVDEQDERRALSDFVDSVAAAGCTVFIVHARKAWLRGLSAKENRAVPPLLYARVYALKRQRPHLTVVLNGGIDSLQQAQRHLQHLDGVMLGRAAYERPWLLRQVDPLLFGSAAPFAEPAAVLRALAGYLDTQLAAGTPASAVVRHWLGLWHGRPGARAFRRALVDGARTTAAGAELIERALSATCTLDAAA
ncbi:MAG: tRNA dihydrouridine(20/20a) synthase DusA [Gammaproteobacteria bacterium]|nr:tRNA dihydrouridine(20/20a) synthase DusA [Gammaproteobacteria bacterium]